MRTRRLLPVMAVLISAASAADFLPLQPGNTWTYRQAATGGLLTMSVGPAVTTHERVYHMLSGYADRPLLVRLTRHGDLVQVDEKTGQEQTVTSFTPFEDGWWEAPFRGCPQEGQVVRHRAAHDGPAGPLTDVLEIRYRVFSCADTGTQSEQFAENIGMLRRVTNSIIGPQVFNLISARVGSVAIDALPHAAFSVSARDTNRNTDLTVVLRLSTNSPVPQKLTFPSGQEFEVILLDDSGNSLWSYSASRTFIAAVHQISVSGEWTAEVQIPRSVLPARAQPGTYTIQAWLTTAGSNPRFAATVQLPIPSSDAVKGVGE